MADPTRRQIMQMAAEVGVSDHNAAARLVRLTLAAFRSTPVPVPVVERLPGAEDCDGEGRCWFLSFPFEYSRMTWSLEDRTYGCNAGFSHWLPANALPLPAREVE